MKDFAVKTSLVRGPTRHCLNQCVMFDSGKIFIVRVLVLSTSEFVGW